MSKMKITLILTFLFSFNFLIAQNQDDNQNSNSFNYQLSDASRFSIVGYGGVGYATIDNDNQPNYNLDASTFDVLLNYRIGQRWGIATGLGFNQLTGTGFNNNGQNFYHERGTLKIPLLLSGNYSISPKVRLVANIGFYAQTIIRDDFSFAGNTTIGDVYEGWNFGLQSGFGMSYNFNQKFSLGLMFNTQGDFNRFDAEPNAGFTNRQKTTSVNTVGMLFTFQL